MGPFQFGMAIAEDAGGGCRYWQPKGAPSGVEFMVEEGRLVRVDVDSGAIQTAEKIGIGNEEGDVRAAYGPALATRPHKYQWEAGWRYLIYRPVKGTDSSRAIVFETNGKRVRGIRAGLEPQVEYVERCG